MVEGEGDRDYRARFEVADLGGPLTASGIPIHRIDGVAGDVSILATAYAEDVGTSHGPDGVAMRPVPPKESAYEDVRGDLRVRACRVDLTLEGIAGRVDVENDFGTTRWRCRPAPRPQGSPDRLAERGDRGPPVARRARRAAPGPLHRVRGRPAAPGRRRPPIQDVHQRHRRRGAALVARLRHRRGRRVTPTRPSPCSPASPPPCWASPARPASTSSAGRGRSPMSRVGRAARPMRTRPGTICSIEHPGMARMEVSRSRSGR